MLSFSNKKYAESDNTKTYFKLLWNVSSVYAQFRMEILVYRALYVQIK